MAYGMVGETLYQKYPKWELPGSWHRVLVRAAKVSGVGLGVVTGSLLGGILIGNFFHVPFSDQANRSCSSYSFRNRLLGGLAFFQNLKERRRWAVLGVFVSCHWPHNSVYRRSFLENWTQAIPPGMLSGA